MFIPSSIFLFFSTSMLVRQDLKDKLAHKIGYISKLSHVQTCRAYPSRTLIYGEQYSVSKLNCTRPAPAYVALIRIRFVVSMSIYMFAFQANSRCQDYVQYLGPSVLTLVRSVIIRVPTIAWHRVCNLILSSFTTGHTRKVFIQRQQCLDQLVAVFNDVTQPPVRC